MGKRSTDYVRAVYHFLPKLGGHLADLGVCAMAVLVVVNALLRYGFGATLSWGDEISAFLIVFIVFAGAGSTFIKGRHVRITVATGKLSSRHQTILEAGCSLLALFYLGYLIYATAELALMSLDLNATTPNGIFLFPMQIWLPIGMILLFIPMMGFTINRIKKIAAGSHK